MPQRLPDFAERFTCIGRLHPRWDLHVSLDRFCFRCERCKQLAWALEGDAFVRCPNCGRRVDLSLLKTPENYGYVLEEFEGYTPGGKPAEVSPAKNPRA